MFLLSSRLFVIFIFSSCWIFLVDGNAGSTVGSAWKRRWWGQLGRVDVILEEYGIFGVVIANQRAMLRVSQMPILKSPVQTADVVL